MLKLELDQEIRDTQSRAEADFRKTQQAETASVQTAKKYEALLKELSEVRTRAENERRDLERRLRQSQEKAQSLQEDFDEAKEVAAAERPQVQQSADRTPKVEGQRRGHTNRFGVKSQCAAGGAEEAGRA